MRDRLLWAGLIALVGGGLYVLESVAGGQLLARLLSLTAIWSVAAVALNLTNGTAGILNLGQHGFMLVGAYVTALLSSPKTATVLMAPWARAISLGGLTDDVRIQMAIAVLAGGAVAALFGLLIGIPSLRLRGDYLAIVTLGFGEAIRYASATDQGALLTNGGLGIRGIPGVFSGPVWAFVWLLLTLWVFTRFTQSSYGRALKAIREDETAAEAVGVRLAYHKVLAFTLCAAFAGIAGGLYAGWLRTIDPNTFQLFLVTYLLVAVSVGGVGSNTGALLGTALVVLVRQYLQPLERDQSPETLLGWAAIALGALFVAWAGILAPKAQRAGRNDPVARLPRRFALLGGVVGLFGLILVAGLLPWEWLARPRPFTGLRSVLLALCLLLTMIFRPLGALGRAEFSWDLIIGKRWSGPTDAERGQDAWLGGRTAAGEGKSGESERA